MQKVLTLLFSIVICSQLVAQDMSVPKILTQREQAEVIDRWLEERIKYLLPDLMRREGLDMWLIIAREYNEDPVIRTMLPATWLAARRRTILVVYDPGAGKELETYAIARYNVGSAFKMAWNPAIQPDQFKALSRLIQEKNPKKIGINKSEHFAQTDGITSNEYDQLMNVLPKNFQQKVVSAEKLAIGWLETRTESEMIVYQQIVRIAHQIIQEAFSDKVIQPGITSTDDVVWWMRERIKELKLDTWFHPSVSIQRQDPESFDHLRSFSERPGEQVILPGDLLHTDFGITYLRLNTDTQQHAYILKPGETEPPKFLQEAFSQGNKVQDALTGNFVMGKSGNEILKAALDQSKAAGLKPSIYTHPIGYYGHASGPTIGMWDQQDGVPFNGDYPLYHNTAYSIELNASVFIKEWNKEIRIMLEEDGYFDETGFRYIDGRQKELMVIPRPLFPNGK
ncbi:MAG: M24 family metallopeptidase [Imperialibacter sp.]|uniref:M24 family metallopeptidase n=1 Tax=Imperialibacter sp. TaxID=2038411 RepID=UPI0032EDE378